MLISRNKESILRRETRTSLRSPYSSPLAKAGGPFISPSCSSFDASQIRASRGIRLHNVKRASKSEIFEQPAVNGDKQQNRRTPARTVLCRFP